MLYPEHSQLFMFFIDLLTGHHVPRHDSYHVQYLNMFLLRVFIVLLSMILIMFIVHHAPNLLE